MNEIENQLAIMLKGVAQHTDIPEIRQKLIKVKEEGRPLRIKLGLTPRRRIFILDIRWCLGRSANYRI